MAYERMASESYADRAAASAAVAAAASAVASAKVESDAAKSIADAALFAANAADAAADSARAAADSARAAADTAAEAATAAATEAAEAATAAADSARAAAEAAARAPSKTSDLTNDGDGTAAGAKYVMSNDARLSDARQPTAHSHAMSDVTGLVELIGGLEAALPYALVVVEDGQLIDRANNLVSVTANVTLTLPPFVEGKVRDMLVACTIGLDANDEPWSVTFQGGGGETISFVVEGDDPSAATFPAPDAGGDWWYSFTERAPHKFAVSLKQLQDATQSTTQGGV